MTRASGPLLLLRTSSQQPEADVLAALTRLGTTVQHAVLTRGPSGFGVKGPAGQQAYVLRAAHTASRWRRPLLRAVDTLASRPARIRYALSFDPWFRASVRTASVLVVQGPGADQVTRVARGFAPDLPIHLGDQGLRQLAGALARTAAATPVLDAPGDRDAMARADLLPALTFLLAEDDPMLSAWSTWQSLESGRRGGRTDEAVAQLSGRLLGGQGTRYSGSVPEEQLPDELLPEGGPDRLAERAAMALAVLFHPTIHGAGSPSLLATDPERYLEPVRGTRVWTALTAPAAPPVGGQRDSGRLRVLLLPGPDGPVPDALCQCLQVAPTVKVTALPEESAALPLRGTAGWASLVKRRLTHTGGHGGDGDNDGVLRSALSGRSSPDVVLAHADRTAVTASLMLTGPTRLLLRVEAADLLLPWVHLLVWSRVTAVVADEVSTLDRLYLLVGEPARRVPAQVVALGDVSDELPTSAAGRQLRTLVLGKLGDLVDLSAQGRHEEALDLARTVLADPVASSALLRQAAQTAARTGEPSLQLALLRRWADAQGGPHPRREQLVSQQEGRLRELTPGWRPGALAPTPVQSVPGRVLHLLKTSLPHRTSGYAVRSFYLLREQSRAGTDVVAATALDFPEPGATLRETVGEVPHLRLLRDQVPEGERLDEHQDALARSLLEAVQEQRPAVLHAHSGHRGYDLAQAALAVGRATGIPVVYEVRGLFEAVWSHDAELASRSELFGLRRAVEASCLTEADAVVTLSESMRQDLLAQPAPGDERSLDPERVFVVPNGVDPDVVRPRPRRPDLVDRYALSTDFTFGYVSNLDHPREGQEVLIEAVRMLRERGLPATAVIVGGGERGAELERVAAQLEVADQVVFTGLVPHEEVADYYALLDVFVVPRIDERAARLVTPLKPYEAMSMGLPLVVSDLPALREIIGNEERGLAFPAADAQALADVLEQLRRDGALRERLATAGQEWVVQHRSWPALAARYDEVYARALSPRSG